MTFKSSFSASDNLDKPSAVKILCIWYLTIIYMSNSTDLSQFFVTQLPADSFSEIYLNVIYLCAPLSYAHFAQLLP